MFTDERSLSSLPKYAELCQRGDAIIQAVLFDDFAIYDFQNCNPCKLHFATGLMGESEGDAARLMEVTALGQDNADHHFRTPAGPLAPHYRFGKDWVVRRDSEKQGFADISWI